MPERRLIHRRWTTRPELTSDGPSLTQTTGVAHRPRIGIDTRIMVFGSAGRSVTVVKGKRYYKLDGEANIRAD